MRFDDTIVAVSSPPGRSQRGLIRLSGPRTRHILESLTGQSLPPPRTLAACRLREPHLPVLLAHFRGPASYSGQDMAEMQLPGNAALLDRLLHRVIDAGARPAEPGEFTFRAFAAGKMDLTEAEGVAATIAAASDSQLRAAAMLRRGRLGRWAEQVVDQLANHLALVEAGIDFTDQESVVPITPGRLDEVLSDLHAEIERLLSKALTWAALEALPRVVLVGLPSAGKSTLFNALLGRRRAVVSDIPGTTRDVLCEPLQLEGHGEVMLVDMAGLDDPLEALDRDVQQLARNAIEQADLIINVLDATRRDTPTHPGLTVYTKIDLNPRSAPGEYIGDDGQPAICICAPTGRGLAELRRAIAAELADRSVSFSGDTLALQPRHESALRSALEHLNAARSLLGTQRDAHAIAQVELVAQALRSALDELAGLGGRISPDQVIGRVFATFCVGK
ncbi:MAG: tRNA modification GTPase [Phycisphaeraceae bacterium]|nr:tRNA modification GTPase [Phycisphaeraceae bacterium]